MNAITPLLVSAPATPSRNDAQTPLLQRLANVRFFTFSLLIHLVIVVLGGSVVLIRNAVEAPDFTAGDGELIASTSAPQAPQDQPNAQDTPEFQPAAPPPLTPNIAAITTAAANPTSFQVNTAPVMAKLDGKAGSLGSAGKGLAEKMAGLGGGGMRGGTSRFFGMRENKDNKGIGLVGTFYDAKQTRGRKPTNIDVNQFSALIGKFIKEGWKESVLGEFYKAPNTLSTTQIFIPNMSANEGPKAFEVDKEVQPSRWLVHYRGRISPPRTGNYRFVGAGDDYLVVRLNGKVVLDHGFAQATDWQPEQYYNYGWTGVPKGFARGDKFRAIAGQFADLEVLISERPGGLVFFCLMIEDQEMTYGKDPKGNPILPVFRLADGPMPELEKGQTLPPYDPNAPIWKSQPVRTGSAFSQIFGAK